MPDGHVALERREVSLAEHLGHQAAALDAAERRVPVDGHDTGTLLSAVLQGMQAIVGQRRCVLDSEDAEHPALLMQLTVANLPHHHYPTIFCKRAKISS